jgi:hypothetical protein
VQKKNEAWGLIIPLLDHEDPNVQFFGAHTAQIKITRDWWACGPLRRRNLQDQIISGTLSHRTREAILRISCLLSQGMPYQLTRTRSSWGNSSSPCVDQQTLPRHDCRPTKVFVTQQLVSLGLKLAIGHPPLWPDWIEACIQALSSAGADTAITMAFLAIVAEEVASADLVRESKWVLQISLRDLLSRLRLA